MDPIWLLILLPAAVVSGWFAARGVNRSRRTETADKPKTLPADYFRGLNFLLNEEHDKAIEVLVQALEQDDETVEVQLALGSLFRRRGEVERATRIHQNLVARSNLETEQRVQALFELAQDYLKAGLLDRAENLFIEVAAFKDQQDKAWRYLLQIYEQEKEWRSAIGIARSLKEAGHREMGPVLAQYYCELAEVAITEGRYEDARNCALEALTTDDGVVRARIQLGRVAAINGDHRDAIHQWSKIASDQPAYLGEVIGLISNSYLKLGNLKEFRVFLGQALRTLDDIRLAQAMADVVHELDGSATSKQYLSDWIRKNPSIDGLYRLIQILQEDAETATLEDMSLLEKLLDAVLRRETGYECRHCGFRSKSLHWQCPGCKSWTTTTPRKRTLPDIAKDPQSPVHAGLAT